MNKREMRKEMKEMLARVLLYDEAFQEYLEIKFNVPQTDAREQRLFDVKMALYWELRK